MRKGIFFGAIATAAALALAGCSSDSPKQDGGTSAEQASSTEAATRDLTFAVVTHGEGGAFWSVFKHGVEDAGRDLGVTVRYDESHNDPEKQAQLIEAAVTSEVDGIVVSVPAVETLRDALQRATDAGIPIITANSGSDVFKELNALTHVGQEEFTAGAGAGTQFGEAGATKMLCVIHQQSNIGLEDRCKGAASTFPGDVETFQVTGVDDLAKTDVEIASKLQADTDIDAVLTLDPDIANAALNAIQTSNSSALLATFDLSGDVVKAIKEGRMLFAVDQQQYLQGYLPIVFLTLYNENANTVGGGEAVFTGPGFVTQDNAEIVEQLATEGTR